MVWSSGAGRAWRQVRIWGSGRADRENRRVTLTNIPLLLATIARMRPLQYCIVVVCNKVRSMLSEDLKTFSWKERIEKAGKSLQVGLSTFSLARYPSVVPRDGKFIVIIL